jgi:death on curing protein
VSEPDWLPIEVVIRINEDSVTETGEPFFLRDRSLLESALARPLNHYIYGEEDVFNLATTLIFGIARNHPFAQGNKRTAFLSAVLFLEQNGYIFSCANNEILGKAIEFVIDDRLTEAEFKEMIRPYVVPYDWAGVFADDELLSRSLLKIEARAP